MTGVVAATLCSRLLSESTRNLQASWDSVGSRENEPGSGERPTRLYAISSLAQMAQTDEHADAVVAIADSMARMTGQVLSGAHVWHRRPTQKQWQR